MGQAKLKKQGNQLDTTRTLPGVPSVLSPPSNTGGKGESEPATERSQLATDRCRINLSVPNPIYAALESSAKKLGMSPASIALAALMAYIPTIQVQLDALEEMAS